MLKCSLKKRKRSERAIFLELFDFVITCVVFLDENWTILD